MQSITSNFDQELKASWWPLLWVFWFTVLLICILEIYSYITIEFVVEIFDGFNSIIFGLPQLILESIFEGQIIETGRSNQDVIEMWFLPFKILFDLFLLYILGKRIYRYFSRQWKSLSLAWKETPLWAKIVLGMFFSIIFILLIEVM